MSDGYGEAPEQRDDGLDDGELDPGETLLADPGERDTEQGPVDAPEGYRGATAFGTTGAEESAGQSLDALLRQEEPELSERGGWSRDEQYEPAGTGEDVESDLDDDVEAPDGVLASVDGGLGPDLHEDQVADRVRAEGTQAAEDAAVHLSAPR